MLFCGAGVLFLVTTGLVYVPKFINQGLAGIELTFLANFTAGILLIMEAWLVSKEKAVRQEMHLFSACILICVMLVSVACIGEANFSGPFMFLHVINPLIAVLLIVMYTYSGVFNFVGISLGTLCFSLSYIVYAVLYGMHTGDWLYSIINIEEKGLLFVICLYLGLLVFVISMECVLYRLSRWIDKKRLG